MDIETFTVELPGQLLTGAYVLGAWPREIIEVEVPFQPPTTLALDIFEISDKRRILVCTELACNQGRSITNSWPDLADHLFKLLGGRRRSLFLSSTIAPYPIETVRCQVRTTLLIFGGSQVKQVC